MDDLLQTCVQAVHKFCPATDCREVAYKDLSAEQLDTYRAAVRDMMVAFTHVRKETVGENESSRDVSMFLYARDNMDFPAWTHLQCPGTAISDLCCIEFLKHLEVDSKTQLASSTTTSTLAQHLVRSRT